MKKKYPFIFFFLSFWLSAQTGADIADLVKLNSAQAVNTNRILVTDGNGNLGYRIFSGIANTAITLNTNVLKTSIAKPAIFRNLPSLAVARFITVDDAGSLGYRDLNFVSSSSPNAAGGKVGLSAVNLINLGTILSSQQNGYAYAVVMDANGILGKRPFTDIAFTSTRTATCSGNFTRNNCGTGYTGGTVTYTQSATATATSTTSQTDADNAAYNSAYAQACALVNAGGQNYANNNGSCTQNSWTSTKTSSKCGTFTRNNCPSGYTGGSATYCSPTQTSTYTSIVSQADADAKAQAAADNLAQTNVNNNGQNYANNNGTCTQTGYTSTQSRTVCRDFTKNCPAGQWGSSVQYCQTATETRTSTISQSQADTDAANAAYNKAYALVAAGGQNYADNNGTCTAQTTNVTLALRNYFNCNAKERYLRADLGISGYKPLGTVETVTINGINYTIISDNSGRYVEIPLSTVSTVYTIVYSYNTGATSGSTTKQVRASAKWTRKKFNSYQKITVKNLGNPSPNYIYGKVSTQNASGFCDRIWSTLGDAFYEVNYPTAATQTVEISYYLEYRDANNSNILVYTPTAGTEQISFSGSKHNSYHNYAGYFRNVSFSNGQEAIIQNSTNSDRMALTISGNNTDGSMIGGQSLSDGSFAGSNSSPSFQLQSKTAILGVKISETIDFEENVLEWVLL